MTVKNKIEKNRNTSFCLGIHGVITALKRIFYKKDLQYAIRKAFRACTMNEKVTKKKNNFKINQELVRNKSCCFFRDEALLIALYE